jgi:2-polyprenyl-3-methyl-5-hydroxy-6-metoxy-1,4-benzoquinol methylase
MSRSERITSPRFPSLPLLRQRIDAPELLDLPGHDQATLQGNLRDIRRVNRLFGGTRAILKHLPGLVDVMPADREITILDLGTGSADIPAAVVRWARNRGLSVTVCASDISPAILQAARAMARPDPGISYACYDARNVPLPDRSVDIVLCSLTLHHFAPPDAVRVLREMDRLAARGFILNDLRRSTAGFIATAAASRITTRNPLTRNDAPLSLRRAYTPDELRALLDRAGIRDGTVETAPWFRLIAVRGPRS